MSLWFTIMVNDQPIGYVGIRRTSEGDGETYTYEWDVQLNTQHTRSETNPGLPGVDRCGGGLQHRYADGALPLIQKVLARATADFTELAK